MYLSKNDKEIAILSIFIVSLLDRDAAERANDILNESGTTFPVNGVSDNVDQLFDSLQSIVQASAVLGDRLSVNGLSLPDLLGGLGTVNFYDGDLLGEYGAESRNAANGHYIIVDVTDSTFLSGAEGETFLTSVILHEIAHAHERVHGSENVPWGDVHGPGNTLESWANQMAGELLTLARSEGFDTINEFLDAVEAGACGDS
jgi:hypothetical protein